ncbi:MAG: glutathione S-transferase family protein [Gammaproteobacteria bacterium]|nr:glutathione S-transferase family protein [Gammaproteobacteria bacterium]
MQIWGGATTRTLRAHWMAHELALDYQPKLIGPRSGETQRAEFRALNVKEKVPVLVDDGFVLTESAAIVTYLADTHGAETGLVPSPHTQLRAQYNEWLSYVQMELDAHTLYILRKHIDLAHLYGEAPTAVEAAIEGFKKQIAFADHRLRDHAHLVGDGFTGADIMLTSCLTWAAACGIDLPSSLDDYTRRMTSRAAYQSAAKLNFSITPDGS